MHKTADSIEESNAAKSLGNSDSIKPKKKRGDFTRIAPYAWKPGQSGNPAGRPKNDVAREIAKAVFEQNADAIYAAMAKALLKGNAYTFKELAERGYGKLVEKHEHSVSEELVARLASARKRKNGSG